MCYGQVLLPDTPHQRLRDVLIEDEFPHGQDGSGNPKCPDIRGRTTVGKDDMGGVAAGHLSLGSLGSVGGSETVTLTGAQSGTTPHAHAASSSHSLSTTASGNHAHSSIIQQYGLPTFPEGSSGTGFMTGSTGPAGNHAHTVVGSISTTVNAAIATNAAEAHSNVQPSIVFNKIIKT